jgi:2-dehydro-3-deoxygluconokinase
MDTIKRIAVIGECMVELKKIEGSLQQSFGGDTLNTAVYLSRLTKQHGIETGYVTGLGRDPFSKEMLATWQQESINTDMVYLSEQKLPGIYAIETAPDGERSFFYWRNDSAAKYWLQDRDTTQLVDDLCQHQMIYLSGISLAILAPACIEKLVKVLEKCRQKGVKIAFDNNYRPAIWSSKQAAQQAYSQILSLTDIAFLTFDDEVLLWGDSDEQQAIDRASAFGVGEIVIKRGADACYAVLDGQIEIVAANKIDNVVDTTAAGDSFSAGYLAKRLTGGDTVQAAKAGHRLAGTVIQYAGAIIPSDALPAL